MPKTHSTDATRLPSCVTESGQKRAASEISKVNVAAGGATTQRVGGATKKKKSPQVCNHNVHKDVMSGKVNIDPE